MVEGGRRAKIIVWARDRTESRAALDPVQWLYGGRFTERGLSGLQLTNDVGTSIGIHVFELAQISIRFLAHYLWEADEVDDQPIEEHPSGVLVTLDMRRAMAEHNQELVRKLRVAYDDHRSVPLGVLWQHDDADEAELLSAVECAALLDFGVLREAQIAHASRLGSLATFDFFCRALARDADLGAHYRLASG
jgi:hypothetical protein